MNLIPLLLSLIGGAGGGTAVGKFLKEKGLGAVGNMIVGALGGVGGGALLQTLGLGGDPAAASGTGTDVMSMITGLLGGGAAGGVLTAIVGMIKSAMANKA